jgi:ABC-2 type transport system permease protein
VKPVFEVGLYLQALFGLQFVNYLLFALLALAVHVLVNQKYVGHLVALIALGFIGFASRLGIERMFVYGSDPGWTYTDMRGFEPFLAPWLWSKLYWAAWALLLAVAARLLWARGRESALAVRLTLARHRFTRPTAATAAVAVALIGTVGGFIFYTTNVLNADQTAADITERRAEYERSYGRYAGIPQPRLTGTNLRVEIYPRQRKADIRGTYRLVNSSAVAIDSIHLATIPGVETRAVAFDRPAPSVLTDEDIGYRIYALEKPLEPGDSLQLSFEVHIQPHGFGDRGVGASVVANGTYFRNLDWLPAIGYQPVRELSNAGDRRAHGLTPRPEVPPLGVNEERGARADAERTAFEAVVGTDEDQIAVAPGTLRRSWTEGGRRYVHYVADAPIKSEYAFFSAAYECAKRSGPFRREGRRSRSRFFITRRTARIWSA